MAKLHELLAVEGDLSTVAANAIDEGVISFTKKTQIYRGQTRELVMLDEARAGENVSEVQSLTDTVDSKLGFIGGHVEKFLDAQLSKEATNQKATADLIVDGVTLATDVPATFLLGLERRLKEIRKLYAAIPTLEPTLSWSPRDDLGQGVWEAPAKDSFRTEKTVQSKVLYEATPQHPAQIERWNEDTVVARISTNHTSGMLTVARKSELLGRVDSLIQSTKKARQRANGTGVEQRNIGRELINFINA